MPINQDCGGGSIVAPTTKLIGKIESILFYQNHSKVVSTLDIVTQGSATGTLKTALAGATTSVVSETTAGVTFDTTNEAIEATEDSVGTGISQASTGSSGIHPPLLRLETQILGLACVILLSYVVSQYTAVAKATLQTQSSNGRINGPVWSINLLFACSLIGTTQGSFVTQDSGLCTALTNGFLVKDLGDCGKGSVAVGWTDTTASILPSQYADGFPAGCWSHDAGAAATLNNKWAVTTPCGAKSATCVCWVGATCSYTEGASVNPSDCMCGTKICDTDEGRFCLSPLNKCSESIIPDACTTTDGSAENSKDCSCGLEDCTETTGRFCTSSLNACAKAAPCTTTDGSVANSADCACGTTDCDAITGRFCTSSLNSCSKAAPCSKTDGSVTNSEDCACGTADCDTSTGRFCSSSINACYKAPCATLLLSASGSTTQPEQMGKYTWIGSNYGGKPAYKFGVYYLYWHPNGYWYIGKTLGSTSIYMYWSSSVLTPDLSSPSPTPIKAYSGGWQDENIIISCACPMNNGLSINSDSCKCGSSICDSTKGLYCLESSNQCDTLPLCSNVDGSSANTNDCRCGTAACSASTYGMYCNLAENKCGDVKCPEGATFGATSSRDLDTFFCEWTTVGTDWCVDIEVDRAKLGAHTLTRSSCSFTSAMTVAAGTVLQLTGDSSIPTVVSGMKTTGFFVVFGQLTLDNLIFKEGKEASDKGGAFFVSGFGSRLHMKRSVVRDCEAVNSGGAVRAENGGVLVMEDSTLASNKATKGGAVAADSRAKIVLKVGTTSSVKGNTADFGGGFYLSGGAHLDVSGQDTKLVVKENTANEAGGGLAVFSTAAITVSNGAQMNVTKNTATSAGGFYLTAEGSRLNVVDKDTKLFMVENIAKKYGGGAWLIDGPVFSISSSATVACETNSALIYGGCLHVQASKLLVKGVDTKFLVNENTANYGGGLAFILSSATISDSAVVKIARNSVALKGGGMLSKTESSVKVSGSDTKLIVEQNTATLCGGGLIGESGASFSVDKSAVLEVRNNIAEKYGGGIGLTGQGTFLNVIDTDSQAIVIGNTAKTGSGGGVGIFTGASLNLFAPSLFRRNSAPNGNGGAIGYVSYSEKDDGGASCVSIDLRIKSTKLNGNGVIEVSTTPNTALSSKDWRALINSDDGKSAGEKVTKWCIPCGRYELRVTTVYGDTSLGAGSFVKLSLSARPDVVLVESTENAASYKSEPSFSLSCSNQGVAATSAIFENNYAKLGGALGMPPKRKNGIFAITASTFINNTAGTGGAAYASGINSGIKLSGGCTMEKNSAKKSGGALAIEDGAGLRIEDMVATANQAAGDGGFLYAQFASPILLQNVLISKSSSTHGNGGALAVTASQIALEKVEIEDCSSQVGDGGAIFLDGQAEAHILRSDLINNNAASAGGHIKLAASTLIAHGQNSQLTWPASKPIFPEAITLWGDTVGNPKEASRRYSGVVSWGDRFKKSMLDSEGAWYCPTNGNNLPKCWLEIDLGDTYTIKGVVTQGCNGYNDWVKSFEVLSGTSSSDLISVGNFTGNSDQDTIKVNYFFTQVKAKYVRIVPKTHSGNNAAIRVAVLVGSNDKEKTSFTRGISNTDSGGSISCSASSSSAEKPIQIFDTKPASGSCYPYQKDIVSNKPQHACFSKGVYLGRGTIISESIAKSSGGAIDAVSCSIALEQVTLKRNKAQGIDKDGGAIHLGTASKLNIDASTHFVENSADHGSGGAIACNHCDSIKLSGATTFTNNTADHNGGALSIINPASPLITSNESIFSKNIANKGDGGGVFFLDATTKGVWKAFKDRFEANVAVLGAGGALSVLGVKVKWSKGVCFKNSAVHGSGNCLMWDSLATSLKSNKWQTLAPLLPEINISSAIADPCSCKKKWTSEGKAYIGCDQNALYEGNTWCKVADASKCKSDIDGYWRYCVAREQALNCWNQDEYNATKCNGKTMESCYEDSTVNQFICSEFQSCGVECPHISGNEIATPPVSVVSDTTGAVSIDAQGTRTVYKYPLAAFFDYYNTSSFPSKSIGIEVEIIIKKEVGKIASINGVTQLTVEADSSSAFFDSIRVLGAPGSKHKLHWTAENRNLFGAFVREKSPVRDMVTTKSETNSAYTEVTIENCTDPSFNNYGACTKCQLNSKRVSNIGPGSIACKCNEDHYRHIRPKESTGCDCMDLWEYYSENFTRCAENNPKKLLDHDGYLWCYIKDETSCGTSTDKNWKICSASEADQSITTCTKCPLRSTTQSLTGTTSIDKCVCNEKHYRSFNIDGKVECVFCPLNSQIVNQIGPVNNACACRENYYAEIIGTTMTCIKCANDKSAPPGSTECQCKKGTHYLSDPATGTCDLCPPEADCSLKSGALLIEIAPKPGYWRHDPNSTDFADCAKMFSGSAGGRSMAEKRCCPIPFGSNTSICMQQLLSNSTDRRQCRNVTAGAEDIDSPAEAYGGPMCQSCSNDFSISGGKCKICIGGSSVGNVITLLIPFFVFLLIIFIVIFLKADKKKETTEEDEKKKKKRCCCGGGKKKQQKKKKVPKKSLEEQIEDKKGQNAAARLLGDQALLGRMQGSKSETTITASSEDINRGDGQVIADRVKVVYGWLQCFTAITFTFDVAWPANLKLFSLSLNFINLDLGNMMAGSKCSFAISALEKFYVHMALPAVLLVVILLARIPAIFLRKSKTQRIKQRAMMMKLITALALIMYPGICVRLFSTLKCIKVPGLASDVHSGMVMASDYAVQCYVGEHAQAVVVALIFGVTWVFGIPAAVLVALRCNKKHLYNSKSEKHEDIVDEFGTLFLQYEPAYYWWEVTVIFKKSKCCKCGCLNSVFNLLLTFL